MERNDDWDELREWDRRHVWHPFTPMEEWCDPGHQPVFIVQGRGVMVQDQSGRWYIDGNSSIWTNIHGHRHPVIDAAIRRQLERIAHSSALGFASAPAARLARELVSLWPGGTLTRVFFSDDGSTAVECAMKMAVQCRMQEGHPDRCGFAAFDLGYHGDTLGAVSLGGIDVMHGRFRRLGLPVRRVRSMDELEALPPAETAGLAAVVIEPLIQGAAGMKLWPAGMLRRLRSWCDARDVFLICDEVMTGFGRTGRMFACHHEDVVPDFVALAKGLTGGYLPLAATLTTERVFSAFLGPREAGRTFLHGHSYTGNPLGCAAALASLEVFRSERTLEALPEKIDLLRRLLARLQERSGSRVTGFRQCGLIAGIDIRPSGVPGAAGRAVCLAARDHGLLTRPIADTVVLMPPLSITTAEIEAAVEAVEKAVHDAA